MSAGGSADDGTSSLAGVTDSLESAEEESEENKQLRGGMVRSLIAVIANVGVLTALLVYFGWVRSAKFATYLGIDEAILQMSVDEYVRRSVESVFIIPLYAAFAGLAWVGFDHWLRRRRLRNADDPLAVFISRWMWVFALAVFLLGIAFWLIGTAFTYIAAPLVSAGGLLLGLYALGLRATLPGTVEMAPLSESILRGAVALLVAIGLFWTAQNYATVQGTELAYNFSSTVANLPDVEIDSDEPLDIVAPGVVESCLDEGASTRYHYRGLKYLESTGGNYFLISDEWTREYGVVIILPMQADGLRYSFVRDYVGARDAAFPPCEEDR